MVGGRDDGTDINCPSVKVHFNYRLADWCQAYLAGMIKSLKVEYWPGLKTYWLGHFRQGWSTRQRCRRWNGGYCHHQFKNSLMGTRSLKMYWLGLFRQGWSTRQRCCAVECHLWWNDGYCHHQLKPVWWVSLSTHNLRIGIELPSSSGNEPPCHGFCSNAHVCIS